MLRLTEKYLAELSNEELIEKICDLIPHQKELVRAELTNRLSQVEDNVIEDEFCMSENEEEYESAEKTQTAKSKKDEVESPIQSNVESIELETASA